MQLKYQLGWLPDVPDVRDVPFKSVFRVPSRLPASLDLRQYCSPVESQGSLGSCTAQALVGVLEFLQLRALMEAGGDTRFYDLSRLFVYYNEREEMGTVNEDSGAMLRTGIKVLKRLGVCRESLWPYRVGNYRRRPSKKCYTEAGDHQVTAYQRLQTLQEMKACLAMGLPFVFGFAIYEHVMTSGVAKSGKVRMPRKNERMLGGHAVAAVGYDNRKKELLFRNSWGIDWGRKGYGTLPYAYLESRELTDDFWCVQATESDRYHAAHRTERGHMIA